MLTLRCTRRTFAAGLALAGALAGTPALAQSTLERAKADGYIRVGFANEAPFGFATADGKLTGEAPEVAKAVLAKMGINRGRRRADRVRLADPRPEGRPLRHHRRRHVREPGPLRRRSPSPSPPTASARRCWCPAGNPKGIVDYATFAANPDLKLAVMAGAVEAGYANDAGVGLAQLVSLPDQASLVAAVQAGRADAAALTALSIADMASKAEGVESTKPFGEVAGKSVKGHGAFGFRKEDTDLLDAFNAELETFIGSPEHHRAGRAVRLRRRLPAEQDHRRALRRRVTRPRGGRAPPPTPSGDAPWDSAPSPGCCWPRSP